MRIVCEASYTTVEHAPAGDVTVHVKTRCSEHEGRYLMDAEILTEGVMSFESDGAAVEDMKHYVASIDKKPGTGTVTVYNRDGTVNHRDFGGVIQDAIDKAVDSHKSRKRDTRGH